MNRSRSSLVVSLVMPLVMQLVMSLSVALAAAGCRPEREYVEGNEPPVVGAFPPAQHVLPLNGRPLFFVRAPATVLSFSQQLPDGASVPLEQQAISDNGPLQLPSFVVADISIEASEDVRVTSSCEACQPGRQEHAWSVASEPDVEAPVLGGGAVTVDVERVREDGALVAYELNLEMPTVGNESDYLIRIRGSDFDGFSRPGNGWGPPFSFLTFRLSAPRASPFCFELTAVDVAGNESSEPIEWCIELP